MNLSRYFSLLILIAFAYTGHAQTKALSELKKESAKARAEVIAAAEEYQLSLEIVIQMLEANIKHATDKESLASLQARLEDARKKLAETKKLIAETSRPEPVAATTTEKLPSRINNIESLYWEIWRKRPKKSQFETDEQFKKRVEGAMSVYAGKTYALRAQGVSFAYDANKREVNAEFQQGLSRVYDSINLRNAYKTESSIGTNAFGARTRIKTIYGDEYYLKPDIIPNAPITIPMPPDKARKVMRYFAVIVVVQLSPDQKADYLGARLTFSEPTFSKPFGKEVVQRFLQAKLKSIYVYNMKTNEVISMQIPEGIK